MRIRIRLLYLALFLVICAIGMCCTHMAKRGGHTNYCGDRQVNPAGIHIAVPHARQEYSSWCWITTGHMIAAYYADRVSQCAMASEVFGRNCCVATSSVACNKSGEEKNITKILENRGIHFLRLGTPEQPLDADTFERTLQEELSNGRPVMLTVSSTITMVIDKKRFQITSHTIVIAGFRPEDPAKDLPARYDVLDPNAKEPLRNITFKQLREGTWEPNTWRRKIHDAWIRLSPRPDGCSPVFDPYCNCRSR